MTDSTPPGGAAGQGRLHLRLYVVGNAPNSMVARRNLQQIRERYIPEPCQVEIVDLAREPARAAQDGVLITPTLICLAPHRAMVLGNLADTSAVLAALGL
jgi:circadian clock protein KaiB